MSDKSLLLDLDDPRAARVAEVIANSTCKRILYALADGEMSESEIAGKLSLPLNTVGYNVKKLMEAELIEQTGGILWSVKGKRGRRYKVSGKRIILSPKQRLKGIVPAILAVLGFAGIVGLWEKSSVQSSAPVMAYQGLEQGVEAGIGAGLEVGDALPYAYAIGIGEPWIWILLGAVIFASVFLAWNRLMKGGGT